MPAAPWRGALRADAAPLLCLVLVGLACAWPVFLHGFPASTWDGRFHFLYAEEFLHELGEGRAFPRWLPRLNDGLGAPTFYYYGPVAYYVTSLAGLVTGRGEGLFLLGAGTLLLLLASGLSAHALFRAWVGPWPAAAGAAVFMALPYHLLMDVWTRAAFAEAAAYAWLPLVFRGVEDIRAGRRGGALLLALALGLLVATHIITALLACIVLGGWILLRLRGLRPLLAAGLGIAGGLGLSAVYLLPALALRDLVHVPVSVIGDYAFILDAWWRGYRPERATFLALTWIAVAQFAAVLVLGAGLLLLRRRDAGAARLGLTWAGLTLALLVSTTVVAAPLWHAVPVLANVQFPYRMLTLADLGTAATVALFLAALAARWPGWQRLLPAAMVGAALLGAGQGLVAGAFGNFRRDAETWRIIETTRSVSQTFRPAASYEKLPFDPGTDDSLGVPPVALRQGVGEVRPLLWSGGRIEIAAELATPAVIQVAQLHFGLWRATGAGGAALPVTASEPYGLVEIAAPAGAQRITLALAPSPAEQAGAAISALAVLGWLAAAWVLARRGRRPAAVVAARG